MKHWIFALLVSLVTVQGCLAETTLEQHTLVLPYSAFGPPSMSGQLLGSEWFQWYGHGDPEPRTYPVKVVVYRDVPLNSVQQAYPVDKATETDHRYVSYNNALVYFNTQIADVDSLAEEGFAMGDLAKRLSDTKDHIINVLGD